MVKGPRALFHQKKATARAHESETDKLDLSTQNHEVHGGGLIPFLQVRGIFSGIFPVLLRFFCQVTQALLVWRTQRRFSVEVQELCGVWILVCGSTPTVDPTLASTQAFPT